MTSEYIKIDQYIHQLSQTLAKFGRTYAKVKMDDSHTNLRFDFLGKKIRGRWANVNGSTLTLQFNLENQVFELLDKNYQTIASFQSMGKTQGEVDQEIASYLIQNQKARGTDFLKALHFEIPDYDFKNERIKKWDTKVLARWMDIRHQANQACGLLADYLNVEAEIRIWPHHFDTGIYTELNDGMGIGFGWAMADTMMVEPYYYYSVYGLNGKTIDYSSVKPLSVGHWITGANWNGAVLALRDAEIANIHSFLDEITRWTFTQ